jgi:hypothetical protein
MVKRKFTKVKSRNLFAIKVYLDNQEMSERVEKLAQAMGLSLSKVGGVMIRYGLPILEKAVAQLVIEDEKSKQKTK